MTMKAIKIPRNLFNTAQLERAIENALTGSAKAAKVDFDVTTQTWTKRPEFTIDSEPGKRTISTDNEIYGYVNDGTPPHPIVAKNAPTLVFGVPFKAKTAVRVIGSGAGSKGATIRRPKAVQHPGTDAREFDQVIKEKWDDLLPVTLQRSIDSELT